jgi:serine phosphatase RsbU (regulator of sigma subunit)
VLYTDGVIDAVGVGDRFGETRLRRAVAGMAGDAPDSPAEHLLSVVDDFLAGDQNDDIAIVSLVRSAVAAAPAAA